MKNILEKQRKWFADRGFSDEEAKGIVHMLSAIMSEFIDAAHGVHSAQNLTAKRNALALSNPDHCGTLQSEAENTKDHDSGDRLPEQGGSP